MASSSPPTTGRTPSRRQSPSTSLDERMRKISPTKVTDDDRLVEYDAALLSGFFDTLTNVHGGEIANTIHAAFRTDEIRRYAPAPQDEMRAGMSYIHEAIWKGLPKFLRRVDTALKMIKIDEILPYSVPLIQFSSWMGGDRDGNPRVTPEVTYDVCLLARLMAANLYLSEIEDLMFEVANHKDILDGNPTLRQRLKLREPYLTVLNVQQVHTLKRMRTDTPGHAPTLSRGGTSTSDLVNLNPSTEHSPGLEDTLILTMKGIAAGMQNTG
ncbi:hypothetical protein GOP47_0028604 [Adiantum capillus-veneris]|nr:hypothetical protein GOP47_0028604 [Adiantum capillus-veneris]